MILSRRGEKKNMGLADGMAWENEYGMIEKKPERYLWKFYWNCRRQGSVEGLFVATEEEVKNAVGEYVYFGEILGKHSEIYGTIEEGEIEKVDVDSDAVEKVTKFLGDSWSGYNPLDYIREMCVRCEDHYERFELHEINNEKVCHYCMTEEETELYDI